MSETNAETNTKTTFTVVRRHIIEWPLDPHIVQTIDQIVDQHNLHSDILHMFGKRSTPQLNAADAAFRAAVKDMHAAALRLQKAIEDETPPVQELRFVKIRD